MVHLAMMVRSTVRPTVGPKVGPMVARQSARPDGDSSNTKICPNKLLVDYLTSKSKRRQYNILPVLKSYFESFERL